MGLLRAALPMGTKRKTLSESLPCSTYLNSSATFLSLVSTGAVDSGVHRGEIRGLQPEPVEASLFAVHVRCSVQSEAEEKIGRETQSVVSCQPTTIDERNADQTNFFSLIRSVSSFLPSLARTERGGNAHRASAVANTNRVASFTRGTSTRGGPQGRHTGRRWSACRRFRQRAAPLIAFRADETMDGV